MTAEPSTVGREHWTHKGDVRLFLWEKAAGMPIDYEQIEKDAKNLKTRFNEIYQ